MAEGIAPLIFEIRAKASEVFTELGKVRSEFSHTATSAEADAKKTSAAMAKTGDTAEKASHKSKSSFDLMAGAGKAMAVGLVGTAVTVGGAAIKMGMDFQESMTTLRTGAGQSEEDVKQWSSGILNMAGKVGLSAQELSSGAYLIASAGFSGAQGLKVLQAAAEGAKVGNADMKVVADGVTTALKDYGKGAGEAANYTSKLVATVASGKTTMGDLAGSLSNVLPTAAAAKIGIDQVLGAMATMTGEGISADQASQNLANTIRSLSAPSAVASHAMAQIGINSTDLAANLGKKGLTGTLDQVYQAIMAHMGPSGLVLEKSFNQSKLAAQSAKSMIDGLPKSLQKMAQGYLDGTVTQKEWTKELKSQPATVANLGKQFATVAKQATGFSDQLKSGSGSAQTFNAILSQVMGGATGMNTALALTGSNMSTFKANVDTIGKASAESGGHVKGFAETQKDLKNQLENAKDGAEAMVTSLGMKLIPAVSGVLKVATSFGSFLVGHKVLLYSVAGVIGGVVVLAITAYIAKMVEAGYKSVASFAKMIASGAKWAAEQVANFAKAIASAVMWAGRQAAIFASSIVDYLKYTAAGETWLAEQIAQFKKSIATAGEWVAEHAAMFATTISGWVSTAAAATAAFIAENAAMLGIGIAIAALVAAVIWMATHWKQVWGVIEEVVGAVWGFLKDVWNWVSGVFAAGWHAATAAMGAAWSAVWGGIQAAVSAVWDFLKGVWNWIKSIFIDVVVGYLHMYEAVWHAVWGGIRSAVSGVWGFLQGVWGGITGGVHAVWGVIQQLGSIFSSVFGAIRGAVQDAWNVIKGIFDAISRAVGGVIHTVGSVVNTIGSVAGKIGNFLGFANGGIVPGPIGVPRLAVVHGGEYVLSNDMLAGRQEPTDLANSATNANGYTAASPSQAALTGGPPSAARTGGNTVIVNAHTDADPKRIASAVGWELRAMA